MSILCGIVSILALLFAAIEWTLGMGLPSHLAQIKALLVAVLFAIYSHALAQEKRRMRTILRRILH